MTVLVAGAAVMTLAGVGIATVLREPSGGSVSASDEPLAGADDRRAGARPPRGRPRPPSAPTGEETAVPAGFDNAIAATDEPDGCRLTVRSMGIGKSGPDVECLQKALADAGFYTATINGLYDNATAEAVRHLQERARPVRRRCSRARDRAVARHLAGRRVARRADTAAA